MVFTQDSPAPTLWPVPGSWAIGQCKPEHWLSFPLRMMKMINGITLCGNPRHLGDLVPPGKGKSSRPRVRIPRFGLDPAYNTTSSLTGLGKAFGNGFENTGHYHLCISCCCFAFLESWFTLKSKTHPMVPRFRSMCVSAEGTQGNTVAMLHGGGVMDCPQILWQLGTSVMLPLSHERMNKSMNESIHIVVSMAKSPGDINKKKIVSLGPSEAGLPHYLGNRYKFYVENLSLGILESSEDDEGWYFMTVEENISVQHFCLQLKLYEQVSTPEIKVINKTQENGTCTLMLGCTVEKGDHVTYNWSEKAGTHPLSLSLANSSRLLSLTLGPQHAGNIYICTANNPISTRSKAFHPWSMCEPGSLDPGPPGLYPGLFLGGVIVVNVIVITMVLLLLRRRGKTNHYQPATEEKSLTIYAQVQKSGPLQKKLDPLPAQDPCTTIYVAATEPVPEPAQEPNSITVYASVTLPES
ncbi:signaling lymphocytic activation molecule [Carlito syrichta]|uniref:Signaling lymphocytic activation molecule n=1 Tax=Carlito syrichta TaxID=1868482 RepID=A0A3Q0E279_CARSF|nr:signaling lymphocytic activation molecule [Carlito syrichta]